VMVMPVLEVGWDITDCAGTHVKRDVEVPGRGSFIPPPRPPSRQREHLSRENCLRPHAPRFGSKEVSAMSA
jgi:hypothetical protein